MNERPEHVERPTVPVPAEPRPDGRGAYERALELARQDPYMTTIVPFGYWFRAASQGVSPEQIRELARLPGPDRVTALVLALGGPIFETEQST